MQNRMKKIIFSIIFLSFFGAETQANTGIPTLIIIWPLAWILLIPIIFIEAGVICWTRKELKKRLVLKAVTFANLFSTFLGIPFAWGILFIIELISSFLYKPEGLKIFQDLNPKLFAFFSGFFTSAWTIPWEKSFEWPWFYVSAFITLWSAFLYSSVRSEAWILKKYINGNDIKALSWRANLASYGFLAMVFGVMTLGNFKFLHSFTNTAIKAFFHLLYPRVL
jgi:hypothetical protein